MYGGGMMKKRLTVKDEEGNWQVWEDDYSHPFEALQVAIDRLAEYEDDEESGKIVRFPCKGGDSIWVIYQYGDCFGKVDEPFIEKDTAKFFVYDDNKMKIVPSNYGERSDYWYRVLDIFLTRDEAEKKLQELQYG